MAQKFKFRLEGLLKLRKFKEDKIKRELGEILKRIQYVEDSIIEIENSIVEAYASQNEFLASASLGKMAQFFPQYIASRRSDLKIKNYELLQWRNKYDLKLQELKVARGNVKVVDKMKEKKKKDFDKDKLKKEQEDIEDILNMKKVSSTGGV